MKKLVSLLLALLLCMGAALAETADVTGTWYLNEVVAEGVGVNPAMLGMEVVMTLNADNTAAMDAAGSVREGTWALEGESIVVTFDGEPMPFTLTEGNLVADAEGSQMVFGKEKAEVEQFVLGAAKTDATMADYNGTWNAALVDMMGMQMPVPDMGMSMQIIVADGKVTVLEGVGEEMTTGEGTATVEGGVLSMLIESDTVATSMQLHEGDVLALVSDMGEGLTMSIYFERVVE